MDYYTEKTREVPQISLAQYKAATVIQKNIRGFFVRRHLKMLHEKATIIQKHVRGYLTRKYVYKLTYSLYFEMLQNSYNNSATIIQAMWRGYLSRKNIFDYKKFKEWLLFIHEQNELLVQKINAYNKEMPADPDEIEAFENWIKYLAFKTHHLIGTREIPGIYSSPNHPNEISLIEYIMKSVDMTEFVAGLKEEKVKYALKINSFKETEAWQKYYENMPGLMKLFLEKYCYDNPTI